MRDESSKMWSVLSTVVYLALLAGAVFHVWPWLGFHIPVPDFLFAARPAIQERARPAWRRVEPILDEAEAKAEEAVGRCLEPLREFFRARKAGAPAFAVQVLSLSGKYSYVKSFLRIDDSHARFLAEQFDQLIFPPRDLQEVLEAVVKAYAKDLEVLENELLVRLRADLAESDLGRGKLRLALGSDLEFRQQVQRAAAQLAPALGLDLGVLTGSALATTVGPANLAADLVATTVLRVASAIAAEMGISTTFYGSGVLSGGVTIVAGVAVMWVLDGVLHKALASCGYDAERDVARELEKVLDETHRRIVHGNSEAWQDYQLISAMTRGYGLPRIQEAARKAKATMETGGALGLSWELTRIHQQRSRLLRQALQRLLVQGGGK